MKGEEKIKSILKHKLCQSLNKKVYFAKHEKNDITNTEHWLMTWSDKVLGSIKYEELNISTWTLLTPLAENININASLCYCTCKLQCFVNAA